MDANDIADRINKKRGPIHGKRRKNRMVTFVKTPPIVSVVKVGRNAPCPCGSTQKFKRCCGRVKRELSDGITAGTDNNHPIEVLRDDG